MYPLIRVAKELIRHRNGSPLKILDEHATTLLCWPWDLDIFGEMNNGRVLTLFDLGRFGLFRRMGVLAEMKRRGWHGTVAGTAIRYRRRITAFQKLRLRTRIAGWDARFIYIEQGFFRGGDCAAHAALRIAITAGNGIIPTAEVVSALGQDSDSPALPGWMQIWSDAEAQRPWPPMTD